MKKLIMLFAAASVLCCGCDETRSEIDASPTKIYSIHTGISVGVTISIVYVDGHEYLILKGDRLGGICHSAACPCHNAKEGGSK